MLRRLLVLVAVGANVAVAAGSVTGSAWLWSRASQPVIQPQPVPPLPTVVEQTNVPFVAEASALPPRLRSRGTAQGRHPRRLRERRHVPVRLKRVARRAPAIAQPQPAATSEEAAAAPESTRRERPTSPAKGERPRKRRVKPVRTKPPRHQPTKPKPAKPKPKPKSPKPEPPRPQPQPAAPPPPPPPPPPPDEDHRRSGEKPKKPKKEKKKGKDHVKNAKPEKWKPQEDVDVDDDDDGAEETDDGNQHEDHGRHLGQKKHGR